jgi:hypothetical protein
MQPRSKLTEADAGIALVPVILVVSGLAVFTVALLTAVLSGSRTVVRQDEDYRVSSAVESVAALAAEGLWSRYVAEEGGAAGDIDSFRAYLSGQGIEDAGAGGIPAATDGKDLLGELGLLEDEGRRRFNDVGVDAVQIVRRDVGDATQLFLTVSASTSRGEGVVNPVLNRAVQQVYTVEPADFPGFEYALLANNVNCIFCHTRVDNAERWWNASDEALGTFDRVKVGTLESLIVRHDGDGLTGVVNDHDADSLIAGSLYVRGLAAEADGGAVDWDGVSLKAHPFDELGKLIEDAFGLGVGSFSPAGTPPDPLENLYLGYELAYADQVDGYLPDHFPAPFPDDGGLDPSTGTFNASGAGNRRVDDNEFNDLASDAVGAITAGVLNVSAPGEVIDSLSEYATAVSVGNEAALTCAQNGIQGNVILTGTAENPITITGTLAIDGDLVIQGVVKGSGSIYVRGNVYVPTDLSYADGNAYLPGDAPGSPSGPRTFGIAADGTRNALALTAGGNMMIGDFQRPAAVGGTPPGEYEIVTGGSAGKWNFALSEMALFNRAEWAKTQPTLPGAGGTQVQNPGYIEGYVPRYYGYGANSTIPIFNKSAATWFDPTTGTWLGLEAPSGWNTDQLTYARPNDPADPLLYNADGSPRAVTDSIAHSDGWMKAAVYKQALEYFEDARAQNTPMQIDGLLYTNNAIFGIVHRDSAFAGMLVMNGSIVAADVGMLVPGKRDHANAYPNHSPLSRYAIGLQLNYDKRLKKSLTVKNPFQVQLKRTYWNPTANVL